jgi:hypothetical protein
MDADRRERRDRLLAFEVELAAAACEEVVEAEWGRVLLSPSIPQVWAANTIVLEAEGICGALRRDARKARGSRPTRRAAGAPLKTPLPDADKQR